ncbi:MAG: RNA methyltransferase [Anaerolineae bacterium]|nr:RNA methyltransferase [Anaerolineae bacterium]
MISSLQNEKVKLVKALQTSAKSRRKAERVALEGMRLVRDALTAGYKPDFVLVTATAEMGTISGLLQEAGLTAMVVSDEVMREVSDTEQPQGIVGVFETPDPTLPEQPRRVLILDSIRDPGNLGTILRTAAAAGVEAVLLSPTCVDPYNPKVLRSGMGAHFRVPVVGMSWEAMRDYCAGVRVMIAAGDADEDYDQVDWSGRWGVIIGSEAHGAGDEARKLASGRIRIPMAADTESLNAAVAAGVILFEAVRQA